MQNQPKRLREKGEKGALGNFYLDIQKNISLLRL